jgi:hypothetical protein
VENEQDFGHAVDQGMSVLVCCPERYPTANDLINHTISEKAEGMKREETER